jgi:hypothetical protein
MNFSLISHFQFITIPHVRGYSHEYSGHTYRIHPVGSGQAGSRRIAGKAED